jgi:hypothetical protein
MSLAVLNMFCRIFDCVYIEEYILNGVLGHRFLCDDMERKWYAETTIEQMMRGE